ncbi:hypothetical protein [Pseudoxanthomonas indica]|uniref:hypothetical protein n=1 Tax=Pseudoxanthomonas indica TaxID=428993 RepID=UPI001116A8BF|nr:hypothetical protein [Pseudoxanthomonas indica]GGD56139.1 hypothetical protein GCM10007235_30720 [Pseudoxanthomonas indica]
MNSEGTLRIVATFEAKCRQCGCVFPHPSLGNFAYGETILASTNGKVFAIASAFEEFPQRISNEVADSSQFWRVLAALADPVHGSNLSPELRCSGCGSIHLEYWEGRRIGEASVQMATFTAASRLTEDALSRLIRQVCDESK